MPEEQNGPSPFPTLPRLQVVSRYVDALRLHRETRKPCWLTGFFHALNCHTASQAALPDLSSVRKHRVQMLSRTLSPFTVMRFFWTFARKSRFVRRFEKLTLLPNVLALPHTSHFPDTTILPCSFVSVSRRANEDYDVEPRHLDLSLSARLSHNTSGTNKRRHLEQDDATDATSGHLSYHSVRFAPTVVEP